MRLDADLTINFDDSVCVHDLGGKYSSVGHPGDNGSWVDVGYRKANLETTDENCHHRPHGSVW